MGWKRRVLEVMVDFGMLDAKTLAEEQQGFSGRKATRPRQFLQLELEPSARHGQPGDVNKVCVSQVQLYLISIALHVYNLIIKRQARP